MALKIFSISEMIRFAFLAAVDFSSSCCFKVVLHCRLDQQICFFLFISTYSTQVTSFAVVSLVCYVLSLSLLFDVNELRLINSLMHTN